MKRLAIFGGTFNPPHFGHINVITQVSEKLAVDQALVIPSGVPPHKKDQVEASFLQRLDMSKLAFGHLPNVTVADLEGRKRGPSFTVHTLSQVAKTFPEHELYLVVGGDIYETFTTWYSWQEILEQVCLVITPRPPNQHPQNLLLEETAAAYGKGIILMRIRDLDISSTNIRQAVACGMPLTNLVPQEVAAYMKEAHLYEH